MRVDVLFACMLVHHMCAVSVETRKDVWVLETKPESSARTMSTLNLSAVHLPLL